MTIWVAGVDLGSNSFRALLAELTPSSSGTQILNTHKLKQTVRLAAGLDTNNYLSQDAQTRALEVLSGFNHDLRAYGVDAVRVVATNTFRVAKNCHEFLLKAQEALGYPIDVISGLEEARLIYQGVASTQIADHKQRLVVDIGGGSTELIVGIDFKPLLLNSLPLGCVSFSQRFFPDGVITETGFDAAEKVALDELAHIQKSYLDLGWQVALGSSGTSKALRAILRDTGFDPKGISWSGMNLLKQRLISSGRVESAQLLGIKVDRMPVLAGGLAIMMSVFKALSISLMHTADGALRLGLVHEIAQDPLLFGKN